MGLADYFPWYAWVAILAIMIVAAAVFFVPPSAVSVFGLSPLQHIAVMGGIELLAAVSVAGIVLHYRQPPEAESEGESGEQWRFDP